jgi:glutathione S-transferase
MSYLAVTYVKLFISDTQANMTTQPQRPIVLYGFKLSGHCHRVELFLSLNKLPYRYVEVDILKGEHKQPNFLELNRFGQVPVIDDNGTVLADSNAILLYLTQTYGLSQWYPNDVIKQAQIQRWFSFAAGFLAFGPAMARAIKLFRPTENPTEALQRATRLFVVMEGDLGKSSFLVGNQPTLADISMYSYTAAAPEGGMTFENYPNIRAWLTRVEALPGFVAMAKPNVA